MIRASLAYWAASGAPAELPLFFADFTVISATEASEAGMLIGEERRTTEGMQSSPWVG